MTPSEMDPSVNGWNAEFVDALYRQWQADPDAVSAEWQHFFRGFELGATRSGDDAAGPTAASAEFGGVAHTEQGRVDSLIYHYRAIGHYAADLDPLGTTRPFPQQLELESFNLTESDLDKAVDPGLLPLPNPAPIRDIIGCLDETYCRHIGVQYMHIQDRAARRWLQERMESPRNQPKYDTAQKMRILRELIEADGFESFLDTRYRGKKRFGLDGGESLIPMLDELADSGPSMGVEEYTIAMAHRGRLNVLVNILHKTYDQIFTEFEEAWTEDFLEGGGDVKYHRGYSGDFPTTCGTNIRMTLSPNPSHLEFANSVVLGRARAKQRLRRDTERKRCVPILIHGDASFPGQGIVAECFNMMKLDGYNVGGALHIVVNNQIGFTTNPVDAHSGDYCTDIAKMVEAPIFHVNGDDPEACVFAMRLAAEYRQEFQNDVVVDLWCYRKYGHNEGDEPTFTQPLMYERIRNQKPVLQKYVDRLVDEGVITRDEFETLYENVRKELDAAQTRTRENPVKTGVEAFSNVWSGLTEAYNNDPVETGVDAETLEKIGVSIGSVPESFNLHKKLQRLFRNRTEAAKGERDLDWGTAELLAYGTLLADGHAVRLTGQDVERGTFSHRHAVVIDQQTGEPHMPLNALSDDQGRMCVHNSPLTESACLGFEYGYSLGDPNMLVIWEAQFGDFANGAQVIFDQFIASAEAKWKRYSGLVCLLPHGYEGQGPEHSSARLERFLQLCANDDMQVAYPTTPAQMFHLLRRQMKRKFRKPLIVMSPKSLLRHPQAPSPRAALETDRFHHILDDPSVTDPSGITRMILCSGKVYYDLVAHRERVSANDTTIVRIEQLFPFRRESLQQVLDRYPDLKEFRWVQEEPKNMGAWRYIEPVLRDEFNMQVRFVGRDANSSPAVASQKMHMQEQERLLINALGLPTESSSTTPAASSA